MLTKMQLAKQIAKQEMDDQLYLLIDTLPYVELSRAATLVNWLGNSSMQDWAMNLNLEKH